MSETRQSRNASRGGPDTIDHEPEGVSPEEALAEAQEVIQQAEERAQRAEAQAAAASRERDEARTREQSATAETVSARERSIMADIDTQKSAASQAEQAIATAQAAGDAVAVAAAFRALASAEAKLDRLSGQKSFFDSERERLKTQPVQQQAQPVASGYKVSTPGGEMSVNADVKTWMDQHPRFYNDPGYYSHAITAHSAAVADGYREGSPAYFRSISEKMEQFEKFEAFERGELQQERQVNTIRQKPPASSTAAPVSRGGVASERSRGGAPNAEEEARSIGVTVEDLREAAKWNGFVAGKKGYKSADEAFSAYVKDLREIREIQSRGGDAGLKTNAVYR
jgi:hypothetical protein